LLKKRKKEKQQVTRKSKRKKEKKSPQKIKFDPRSLVKRVWPEPSYSHSKYGFFVELALKAKTSFRRAMSKLVLLSIRSHNCAIPPD